MRTGILSVGRELLLGYTLDTNSHWLAGELASIGFELNRITVVDDVEDEISDVAESYLDMGFSLVVTTGGMGPTPDDMTLAAVARACGRGLELNETALEMVEKTYARLYVEGKVKREGRFEERRKMAMLPLGAEPLPNPVGAAPGSWLRLEDAVVLSLPGVPAELKGIFEGAARERLLTLVGEKGGRVVLTEELPSGIEDESVLCRITRRVMDEIEGIYLKTLPTGFSSDTNIAVRITAFGDCESVARERLSAGKVALKRALEG